MITRYGIMNRAFVIVIKLLMIAALAGCAGPKKVGPREDDVHGARAYNHFVAGDFKRAIEGYKKGYATARKIDNGLGAARYLSNIGRAYYELGQADSAALYFAKAYEEFKVYGDDAGASRSAAFLALCFASAGDEAQARRWFGAASSSLSGSHKSRQKYDEHYYAVVRGMVDFRLMSTVNNESALGAAIIFYKKKKEHSLLATAHLLMADLEFSRGKCVAAYQHLNDALASIGDSREKYRRSGTLIKMAAIKFCAGDDAMGKHYYERAADCAPKGVAVLPMEQLSSCNGGCR